jgi:hypothetical protein
VQEIPAKRRECDASDPDAKRGPRQTAGWLSFEQGAAGCQQ